MQLNQVRQPFCQNCQILLITSVIWQINVIVWFHLCPPRIIVGPMHAECDHTVIIFKDFCCSISLSPEQNHLSHDKTEQNSLKTEQGYQAFNLFLEETIGETRRKQLNELLWSFGMKNPRSVDVVDCEVKWIESCLTNLMDIKVNDEDWWLNIAKVRIIPQWHRWSNSNVIEHTWTQVKDPRCLQFSSWCLQIQDDEFCFPLTFSINWWSMYTSVVTSTWMKKFGNSFKDNRRKATRYFLQKPSPWPAKAWWVPPAILAATILLEPCITACIAATVPLHSQGSFFCCQSFNQRTPLDIWSSQLWKM